MDNDHDLQTGKRGKIIDSVMEVDSLIYCCYRRNAFVPAVGSETCLPEENSTSAVHLGAANKVQTFLSAPIVISIQQDSNPLDRLLMQSRTFTIMKSP